jgi:hypothetical protein
LIVTPDGVTLDTNGITINGYVIQSSLGIFTGDAAGNLGYFREDIDALVAGNMGYTLNGAYSLGDVIGSEYSGVDPTEDLTFTYTIHNQAGTYTGVITIGGGEMASAAGDSLGCRNVISSVSPILPRRTPGSTHRQSMS